MHKFSVPPVHLDLLLDSDLAEAVKRARGINLDTTERCNLMSSRASILADGDALLACRNQIKGFKMVSMKLSPMSAEGCLRKNC